MHGTLSFTPELGTPDPGSPDIGAPDTGKADIGAPDNASTDAGATAGDARPAPVPSKPGFASPQRDPFLNRPSPEVFFAAQPHRAAWTFLRRALRSRVPFVLLTGDFGAGKTMLTLRLVRAIRERGLGPCVHMSTPGQGAAPVLRRTCEAVGLACDSLPEDAAGLARTLHRHLVETPLERRLFVVLEDPQDMDAEAFAHLLEAVPAARAGEAAMTLVMIGHTSLPRLLQRSRFRKFDPRIRKRHHLPPLDRAQTRAYIDFRLAHARDGDDDADVPAFDQAALDRVFEFTHGNPREINNVCGTSLSQARAQQRRKVDRATVDAAARALGRPVPTPGRTARVVVQFPGTSGTGPPVRGSPAYLGSANRAGATGYALPDDVPAAAPTAQPAQPQPDTPPIRPRLRARLRAGVAGAVLLLAAGYLAAPYLTPAPEPETAARENAADAPALSRVERRELETLLRSLDFETGAVDGRLDPTTLDAVQAYKRMAGMASADRTVGPELLEDLRAVTGNLTRPGAGERHGVAGR